MEMWESLLSERESSKCGLGMLCHPSPEERDEGVRWCSGHDIRTRISAVSPRRESDYPRMMGTQREARQTSVVGRKGDVYINADLWPSVAVTYASTDLF